MTSITHRVGAVAAVLSGALLVVAELMYLVLGMGPMATGDIADPLAQLQVILFLLALVALAVAAAGLRVPAFDRADGLAAVAFCTALAGTVLVAGSMWMEVFLVPVIAADAPALIEAGEPPLLTAGFTISTAVFALGWVLVAAAALRTRAFPRWAAVLLAVGAVLFFVPLPFTFAPFGVAIAWIGLRSARTQAVHVQTSPA
jgi:hypothetical protein